MYPLLKSKRDGMAKDVIAFAQGLARRPDDEQVSDRVKDEMEALSYDQVKCDEFGNVVGLLNGRDAGPTLLLNCQAGTVGYGDGKHRAQPPWSGFIEEGRLYGLGALGWKGGIASQVYGAALLRQSMLPLRGNIVVAVTVAQKHGYSDGVRALIEHILPALDRNPSYTILGEPTDLGLYYGRDGWMELEIVIEGMNPFHVDDAAQAVLREIADGKVFRGDSRGKAISQRGPSSDEVDGRQRATVHVDRRLHETEQPEAVMKRLEHIAGIVAQARGNVMVNVGVRHENQTFCAGEMHVVRHVTNAWAIDPFAPLMQHAREALAAANCEVRPGRWELGMGRAGSVLVNEYAIPTIGYGPGSETAVHDANEWVDVVKVLDAAYGTAAIAHRLVGVPVFGWTSDEV